MTMHGMLVQRMAVAYFKSLVWLVNDRYTASVGGQSLALTSTF